MPTAQVLSAAVVTAPKRRLLPGEGLSCWTHAFPFQARISVLSMAPLRYQPTAHTFPVAVPAAIPFRIVSRDGPPGLGLATWAQFWPFQCRIRLRSAVPLKNVPTAQALLAEVGATPYSAPLVPGCGLATWAQLWPFQCRINGWSVVPLPKKPTAQAPVADTVRTALSAAFVPGFGLATRAQV